MSNIFGLILYTIQSPSSRTLCMQYFIMQVWDKWSGLPDTPVGSAELAIGVLLSMATGTQPSGDGVSQSLGQSVAVELHDGVPEHIACKQSNLVPVLDVELQAMCLVIPGSDIESVMHVPDARPEVPIQQPAQQTPPFKPHVKKPAPQTAVLSIDIIRAAGLQVC